MSLDFPAQFKKWHSCSPLELYAAPVVKAVPEASAMIFRLCRFYINDGGRDDDTIVYYLIII